MHDSLMKARSVPLHFLGRSGSVTNLYGFLSKKERDLFELLITLSGIGPKTGLSLVGHLEMNDFETANLQVMSPFFSKVPGIGKKTAERLIVD